jgi:hypothetical protein
MIGVDSGYRLPWKPTVVVVANRGQDLVADATQWIRIPIVRAADDGQKLPTTPTRRQFGTQAGVVDLRNAQPPGLTIW